MPRVAALLDAGMASDIAKLDGKDTFVRPILAGNAYSTVADHDADHLRDAAPVGVRARRRAAGAPARSTTAPAGAIDALGADVRAARRAEERPPRPRRRQGRRLRRPRHEERRELQGARAARRSARRRDGRVARRDRRRHGPGRLAGRPDRQDRRAEPVLRGRDLRRDPAPRRHEGLARRSSRSTRTRTSRSSRSPTTASSRSGRRRSPS